MRSEEQHMNKLRILAEIENIKKYLADVIELKHTISELENSLEGLPNDYIKQKNGPVKSEKRHWKLSNKRS